jgi:glycosyltransferase involved in cell wall biosynthesis
MESGTPLAIGYLWQHDANRTPAVSASVLHVTAVVRALQRRGHLVRTMTLAADRPRWSDDLETWTMCDPPADPAVSESAIRALQRRLRLPYLNLFDSERFARACVASLSASDVLYERFWIMNSGGVMAAHRLGIPIVLEVNGDVLEEYDGLGIALSRSQRFALERLNRWIFRRATHIVTVSEPLRSRTIERWRLADDKVTVVPNGADVERFARPPADATPAATEDRQIIVFVGSFKPWHGLVALVSAFAELVPRHPQARLLLVGDGPLRDEIESRVAALAPSDRIEFTGAVPHEQIPALLARSAIAVLGRDRWAFASPLKLFEYMAAGKAIAAPAAPNIREILEDSVSGLLYDPGDQHSLVETLDRLLRDSELRARLGAEAKRLALERYTWAATVERLEEVFRRVTREHRRLS